jgi:hypothetical protein
MAEKIKITLEVDESRQRIKVVEQLADKFRRRRKGGGDKAADAIESTTKAAKKGESLIFKRLGSASIKGRVLPLVRIMKRPWIYVGASFNVEPKTQDSC